MLAKQLLNAPLITRLTENCLFFNPKLIFFFKGSYFKKKKKNYSPNFSLWFELFFSAQPLRYAGLVFREIPLWYTLPEICCMKDMQSCPRIACPYGGIYGVWFWDGLISSRLQAESFTPIRTTAVGLLSQAEKINCFVLHR